MLYQYLAPFNCISNLFGILRPYDIIKGKSSSVTSWMKLWCLIIAAIFIATFCLNITLTEFSFKNNLELISDINYFTINILFIIFNVFKNGKVCIKLYDIFNVIFDDFQIDQYILKLFAIKMYVWFALPSISFLILAIIEILSKSPPYDIITSVPILLSIVDLSMHLYTIVGLLRVININLSRKLSYYKGQNEDFEVNNIVRYVLSPNIKFISYKGQVYYDINLLCKIYDNLSTSIHLLEEKHGFEVSIE